MIDLTLFENQGSGYQPVSAPNFKPDKIIITKDSFQTKQRRELVKEICGVYPQATIIEKLDLPHNRIQFDSTDPLELHYSGKKHLFLAYIKVHSATATKMITSAQTIGIFRHTVFVHTIASIAT